MNIVLFNEVTKRNQSVSCDTLARLRSGLAISVATQDNRKAPKVKVKLHQHKNGWLYLDI